MSNRLIDLQHITKIYDDNTVLDDLNLYIRENEFNPPWPQRLRKNNNSAHYRRF